MNEINVAEKMQKFKEKAVNLQIKFNEIQRLAQYKDSERFAYYVPDLELLFTTIELSLMACELAVNRTYALYADGFIKEPERYAEEEIQRSIKEVNSSIKSIKSLMEKAVN